MEDTEEALPEQFSADPNLSKVKRSFFGKMGIFVLACMAGGALLLFFCAPPADFPTQSFLKIKQGETLSEIASQAESLHLVSSAKFLKILIELRGGGRHLLGGDYYFPAPVSALTVANHLASGNLDINPVRITLVEGMSRNEMAIVLAKNLPYFDSALFMKKTGDTEGFLFPDTYFISPAADTEEVIALLENNYHTKISPLKNDIKASGMSEHDVITLASIVEKEAGGDDDRAIIAGILLNRLKIGLALQVDAPFLYVPKTDDSPYNTYTHKGLPPSPIDNPGLSSILAVLHPTVTDYLFYLHDKNGVAHFAKTFAEHKRNIQLYLR